MTKKIGIIGATGYTGSELLRILLAHPAVQISAVAARSDVGNTVSSIFPHLRGYLNVPFVSPDDESLFDCDVIFFATPHGVAMKSVAAFLDKGIKVIDLSADFRLKNINTFQQWYGLTHSAPKLLAEAVYGLPEIHREEIKKARLVANPGCHATAIQIGFKPLLENNLITTSLIADSKSGVSGAGRGAKIDNLFAEMGESFKAYSASGHRHTPEIEQELSYLVNTSVSLTFVPHLVPMIRGIEATLYAPLKTNKDIYPYFIETYADEPFIDVMEKGAHPDTRSVKGTNMIRIGVHQPKDKSMAIITVVEDNLVKGAAGQAIQCMNLMLGIPETAGLTQIALMP
ncbi:N-acetyl-gamma-glutamyl-phosphate reductase [Suttonella ornithocola]|uniref:N-acetyl-gamma-glutamyl-phosphate reductase n=1 Tax=Suttonella ornithocola TaxID=279832 RepID=A0A380N017_9GAMM|nr:N-acetyl-gamma-glutamyl-phosphate reductase [Suttonella ornithocola]SUO97087.1 N-acetyl-gamma-glutamyl-phosphate reductase [Suttonella ornithocola]